MANQDYPEFRADGPLELIRYPADADEFEPFLRSATQMCKFHNAFIRSLNAIIQQAPHVKAQDAPSFLEYCKKWSEVLHGHHDYEEEIYFPALEKAAGVPGLMSVSADEHKTFTAGLITYDTFIESQISQLPKTFDAEGLIRTIGSFSDALRKHLVNEIPTILSLRQYKDKLDIEKVDNEARNAIRKKGTTPMWRFFYIITAHDSTFDRSQPLAPQIPWVGKQILRGLMWWKESDMCGRWGPCTSAEMPKQLYARPSE